MAYAQDEYGKHAVIHFIDDAVITDPDASQSGEFTFECAPGIWGYSQLINGFNQTRLISNTDFPERLGDAGFNLYAVAYASLHPSRERDPPDRSIPGALA